MIPLTFRTSYERRHQEASLTRSVASAELTREDVHQRVSETSRKSRVYTVYNVMTRSSLEEISNTFNNRPS